MQVYVSVFDYSDHENLIFLMPFHFQYNIRTPNKKVIRRDKDSITILINFKNKINNI